MLAALRLKCFQYRHHYLDLIKVLLGMIGFEVLILYIQKKDFLENFETTRMALFLLLFSTSLLILVQTSISISRERAILERDFFSGLSRPAFGLASICFESANALIEALVFVFSYRFLATYFSFDLGNSGAYFKTFLGEVFLTVLLVYLCAHFMGLLISALTGRSEISSVILAVVVGIMQFSLSGTILQLPKAVEKLDSTVFLSYGHKLFGMTSDLHSLPSAMAKFQVPIEKAQLDQFKVSDTAMLSDWGLLAVHACLYALLFVLSLSYQKK